ncbi:MAG: antibiotic biosynthesis monooxygenase [Burkholderiales bacterium]|nr:antibiotic biosynthesis monooxygenase [Burkholderiales bacterium]GIK88253.1 MAG: antibiotic biosynthesis monooxygenase [Betaproteobacteria bacterium]
MSAARPDAVFHTAHLRVRADAVEPFRARLERHARTSVGVEPGCSRFDVHQERDDPTLFLLVECYDDEAAFRAHRASAHFLAFREDVKDWVVERTWWYWNPVIAPRKAPD